MLSRCLAALAALLAVLVAGCGSSHQMTATTTAPVVAPKAGHCSPASYAMQCALPTIIAPGNLLTVGRAARGVDFAWGPPTAGWMRANGFAFGASYLSFDAGKNWSRGLVDAYRAAGVARVFVWETTAQRSLGGCAAGASDARAAALEGFPLGARAIYFAVDFELQPSEANAVAGYFRCVGRVIGVSRTGAYGGLATIRLAFNAHVVRYGWQTYAWSGGVWDQRAQLQQYQNGSSFDYDRAVAADYGQAPAAGPTPAQGRAGKRRSLHKHEALERLLHGDIERHQCRRGQHVIPRRPLHTRRRLHNVLCPRWNRRDAHALAVISRYHREGVR